MQKIKKIIKMTGILLIGLITVLALIIVIVLNTFATFGGSADAAAKDRHAKSPQFDNGKFINQIPTSMDMNFSKIKELIVQYANGIPNQVPKESLPNLELDSIEIAKKEAQPLLTWFGHSAFLLKMDQKIILIDPMFGERAAPFSWMGPKRFPGELPIETAQLPPIDAVILSHDHYDHLDYETILMLKNKTKHFYVPLGVDLHLKRWGVTESKITVLDWYQNAMLDSIQLTCTPARHFSGRGLNDRSSTLWASWVIKSPKTSIYFSGDSGYGPHFKAIGEKYGPFDFAMIECGQYDEKWEAIHMMPEESALAAVDLQTATMMPIHWGAFALALHSWTDPVERVSKKANELGVNMVIPKIGQTINPLLPFDPKANDWWKQIK